MPKQILLVDDSVTIHRVVEITFAREDYAITAVKSGDEAIAKARELKPDLVLADAGLSGKTGYDVCAALRADPATANVACLILTGNFAPYDEVRGQKAGADGFVVKPFETQALLDKSNDVVTRKRAGGGAPLMSATPSAPPPVAAPPVAAPPPPMAAPPPPTASMPTMAMPAPVLPPKPVTPMVPPVAPPAPPRPPKPQLISDDNSVEISIEASPPPGPPPRPPALVPPTPPPMAAPPLVPPAPPMAKPPSPPPPAPPRPPTPAPPPPMAKPVSPPAAPQASTMMMEAPRIPPPVASPPTAPHASTLMMDAPRPAPAPPQKPPQIGHTLGATTMPANVPTMPRPSLIPNTATPSPITAASRPVETARPTPRATIMGMPAISPVAPLVPPKPAVGAWAPPKTSSGMKAVDPAQFGLAPEPAKAPEPAAPAAQIQKEMSPLVAAVTEKASAEVDREILALGGDPNQLRQLSREVIEKIAWEVVPELAEAIVKAHVAKTH